MLNRWYSLHCRVVVLAFALALPAASCKKAPETPRTDETVVPTPTATPTNPEPRPGLPSGSNLAAGTSTTTPEIPQPLAPTPKEIETNRAAAEEYYRSPRGASGSAERPTGSP